MQKPVRFKWKNGGLHEGDGWTKDVSTAGVLLECAKAPEIGSAIELVVQMPAELSQDRSVRVLCKGTVVRAASNAQKRVAVGVKILSYEVLEETEP